MIHTVYCIGTEPWVLLLEDKSRLQEHSRRLKKLKAVARFLHDVTVLCFRNSIHGSAVCAFRMRDVDAAFAGPFKGQSSATSNWLPVGESATPTPHPAQVSPAPPTFNWTPPPFSLSFQNLKLMNVRNKSLFPSFLSDMRKRFACSVSAHARLHQDTSADGQSCTKRRWATSLHASQF